MSGKRAAAAASWLTVERRGKLYRVAVAAGALAVFYGLISGDALPLWLGLAASMLGNVQASAYTPATKGDHAND